MKYFTQHEVDQMFEMQYRDEVQFKLARYRQLNACAQKGGILFTGSSLMEQFPLEELCRKEGLNLPIYNRGISGFTTDDFLREIDTQLLDLKPSKVFMNIGSNDIRDDPAIPEGWLAHLTSNYHQILTQLRQQLPECAVYLMAYYPVNPDAACARTSRCAETLRVRTNQAIACANHQIELLAKSFGATFINVNSGLFDSQGRLKEEFTVDGIHLWPTAYGIVLNNLRPNL